VSLFAARRILLRIVLRRVAECCAGFSAHRIAALSVPRLRAVARTSAPTVDARIIFRRAMLGQSSRDAVRIGVRYPVDHVVPSPCVPHADRCPVSSVP